MTASSATNLQQRIFAPPTNLEEMYRNTALDMLAAIVWQQIRETGQIQVIKGEHGLGKSIFCKRLLLEAPADSSISLITADRKTGITEILHVIAGSNEDDTRAPLQVLAKNAAQKIYQQLYNELQPVLLIDEAHCLSTQTLANLFRFQSAIAQQNTGGGLKVVLIGERKLDTRLEKVDKTVIARDRFLSNLLRPLSRNEIEGYIQFKLSRAEGAVPKLNPKQLQYVRNNSGGIPGKIEELCLRALQGKSSGGKSAPVTVLALTLIAGALAYYQGLYNFDGLIKGLIGQERAPAPVTPPPAVIEEPVSPPVDPIDPVLGDPTTKAEEPIATENAQQIPGSLAWLSNQPAEFYLIQLVGGHDQAKMENYRLSLQLPHPLTLHKTERNGED